MGTELMGSGHEQVVAGLNKMNGGTLGEKMGIEFLEATPQRVVGRMPVAGNTQPFGLLHGGASVVLAETLGSIGAVLRGVRNNGTKSHANERPRPIWSTSGASSTDVVIRDRRSAVGYGPCLLTS